MTRLLTPHFGGDLVDGRVAASLALAVISLSRRRSDLEEDHERDRIRPAPMSKVRKT